MTEAVVPLPAPKPQDRKPKKKLSVAAREAEADDGLVTVEHCGLQLRIPIRGKMPLKAYIAFSNGDELGGTELLLGPEQWKALLATNPTLDDFNEIGMKLEELSGK